MPKNKRPLIFSFAIFVISILVFLPSIKNDFVWDDEEVIEKTHFLYKASSIKDIIIPSTAEHKKALYYRPVHYISIVFDNYLWGVRSFGFHLTNILLHALNSLLVFFLFRLVLREYKVSDSEFTPLIGAVLFVLQPIHTESVSWVAGRTDMLSALFFLLAFIFHIKLKKNRLLLPLAGISYFLSLLSKELAIAFPLVVLSFDYLSKNLRRSNILIYFCYLALTILYLYLRGRAYINVPEIEIIAENTDKAGSLFIYLEPARILLNSYFFYIYKLLFPVDLNAFIAAVPKDSFYTLSSLITLVFICSLTFYFGLKKHSLLLFSFLFVLFTLGPSVTVALSGIAATPLAERYLYLPSVGFIIMITYLINKLRYRLSSNVVVIIFTLIALSYLVLCINRQAVWKDSLSLWTDTSSKSYLSPIVHTNYGSALADEGQYEKAIKEFRIALSPELGDSNRGKALSSINLGNVYISLEKYSLAEKWFIRANKFDPSYGRTYYHLGLINFIKAETTSSKKYYKTAEKHLLKTFEYYHSYGIAHLLLSKVYIGQGKIYDAKKQARLALSIGLSADLSQQAEDIIKIDNKRGGKNP
ncbi:MAG: tetratricopeptide repeat protein [Candidatus Dadabacteria bacterium]|nr:tetratricopeptide repeat protein [Candidatus Dadabacteria bacterium]NIS07962.1 tetratricopeptide repeat protein [Candidatus Dadabacteria bacterium]NIV43055.1 hypothetical protein [Candidatus Dadabacteria bacterium]NIX14918.1 hypothetical protein [Candidatus Dadabacteria bacterium]NIY21546.1 hypothetical protein [Candidatus Dadabacteria bacterium]